MDTSPPVLLDASYSVSDSDSEVKPHRSYDCSSLKDTWKVERPLGNNELSYFLPSRADGVNDMYLHLGFVAPEHVVRRARVLTVWAILRIRHPLLASKVVMQDYDDVRFVFNPPQSPEDALVDADSNLEYRSSTKDELIDSYLNGARTLSNDRLSYLVVSQGGTSLPSPPLTPRSTSPFDEPEYPSYNHDIMICAAHFLGDGMALHQFANDFFGLLGGDKTIVELEAQLKEELSSRWDADSTNAVLPNALEDNFTVSPSRLRRAAEKVDFQLSQRRFVGGHSFRRQTKQPRHTIVPTVSYDTERTKSILKRCKTHGVSVSAAMFAACNIAWAKMCSEKQDLSMMMYSALNLRPYFTVKPANDSYWFLAIGYFNVILPTFIPRSIDLSSVFWHRARVAKEQSIQAAKNQMIVSRSLLMTEERGKRACIWAKEDDERERGTFVPPPPVPAVDTAPRTPSTALIGLSLLGNLDGIYKHGTFPTIKLHTLTTGSRQRSGGMLLFGYTFAGKLWVSLGYDKNGFDKVMVEQFWENMLQTMDELL
ncbi:uncharacterized protein F5891DRAFT_1012458 [Suillus fuscotomentosus]|uniref:Uncharacterized protein n=1 Tax=Suillus fuscotomentosus TaxID=1912939 RepID=A0AAD4EER8_9AGAM|nr:uncharacterized protein F5891DRAFT_1012458 [Suillus fuscotomentosus]KAG1904712.1 hypothetical protein F5891DRAFT_1012458 [Suillus fuscotomentosus]